MNKFDFKVKVNDSDLNLSIVNITSDIQLSSNQVYSKALFDAIDRGLPLISQVEDVLRKRNLMDDTAKTEEIDALSKKIRDLERTLKSALLNGRKLTKDGGREIALEIKNNRAKLRDVGNSVNNLFSNTAERYADNERFQYYVYRCTVYTDSMQPYWKNYEEFRNDSENPVYTAAFNAFLTMRLGIDTNYEKALYENRWLMKMGFMNMDLQLIDGKGRLIDEKGRLIDKDGNFVNEAGNRVDAYGNLVNDKGELAVEDQWGVDEAVKEVPDSPQDPEN